MLLKIQNFPDSISLILDANLTYPLFPKQNQKEPLMLLTLREINEV